MYLKVEGVSGVWRNGARDQGHAEGWFVMGPDVKVGEQLLGMRVTRFNKYLLRACWMPG